MFVQLMHNCWATHSPSCPRAYLPAFPPTYPPAYPPTYLPTSQPAACCPPAGEHFRVPVPAFHCRASHSLLRLPFRPRAAPALPASRCACLPCLTIAGLQRQHPSSVAGQRAPGGEAT